MHLDRMKTLSFISALTLAYGCASKNNGDDTGAGGGYSAATGGASSNAGGSTSLGGSDAIPPGYCNDMLAGLNCGQTRLEENVRVVNMLLVLDQSGSMNKPSSSAATASKWVEMKSALSGAMKPVAEDINFGLLLFPYSGNIAAPGVDPNSVDPVVTCQVPTGTDPNPAVAVGIDLAVNPGDGLNKLNAILDVVGNSTPAGGTPTAVALEQAFSYFTEGAGSTLPGTKWVLLATDGGPNCNQDLACNAASCTQNIDCTCGNGDCNTAQNCCAPSGKTNYGFLCLDDAAVVQEIQKLATSQIKTFVVGIPGTDQYAVTLNQMANAGMMVNPNPVNGESYYAVSTTDSLKGLQDTFSTITTQLLKSCDVELQETPQSVDRVIVAIDCVKVPSVPPGTPSTGGQSGFYIDYRTDGPAHLQLTGSYCDQISTLGAKHLDVITGCQPIN